MICCENSGGAIFALLRDDDGPLAVFFLFFVVCAGVARALSNTAEEGVGSSPVRKGRNKNEWPLFSRRFARIFVSFSRKRGATLFPGIMEATRIFLPPATTTVY